MKGLLKKIVVVSVAFLVMCPVVSVFAQNYNYHDSWSTIEYKDEMNSKNKATYSTRFSARQANCEVVVTANDQIRTNKGYQTAKISFYTDKDSRHSHKHSGY